MRVAIVENTPVTQYGLVGQALMEAAAQIRQFHPRENGLLPEVEAFDALVVFGGEQTAIEDDTHPYLPQLAARMREFVEADRAVLGICLGAQLMARGFGAENYIGTHPERGWVEVSQTPEGQEDPLMQGVTPQFRAFQLHSDNFALPADAKLLARSGTVAHQAFKIGRAGYATQFHFEASRRVVAELDRRFPEAFCTHGPGWAEAYGQEEALYGEMADASGLQLARNWVAQIRI